MPLDFALYESVHTSSDRIRLGDFYLKGLALFDIDSLFGIIENAFLRF